MKRPISLTLRLTVLFGLLLVTIFTALGWYIMHAMESHFVEEDRRILRNYAREAHDSYMHHRAMGGNPASSEPLNRLTLPHGLSLEIVDPATQKIRQRTGVMMPHALLRQYAAGIGPRYFEWGDHDEHYRSLWLGEQGFGVMATVSTHHHDQFVQGFSRNLLGILTLILIVAWGLSWFVVRQALAPLSMIRERAAQVTVETLDNRIPLEQIPSEMAPMAKALNAMMGRLDEAFGRLVTYSSDLAHELRTPVSNLMTQIQVALAQQRTAEAYRDVLASCAEECERLSRMISEMLFLARAENTQVLPSKEIVDLGEQIHEVIEYYEVLAESRGISLEAKGDAQISCDRSMLRRALSNLISNGIRHARENSTLGVVIQTEPDWVQIDVSNLGDDIPAQHLAHIFDRFYQANEARSATVDGMHGLGLGLAITRAIMNAHGGYALATSSNGTTTFSLRFPR